MTFHVPVEEGKTNFAVLEAVSDHFVEFELYQNLYCLLSLWMCVCVSVECCGFESHPRQLIFLKEK